MFKLYRVGLLGLVLLTVPACVQLTGQRITWSYDAGKDEIQILLFYDGIHDSGNNSNGKGVEQIPKFVEHGDVMILDWPFHIDRAGSQQEVDNAANPSPERDFQRLLLSIRSETVGYYHEPDGRIGAVQRLTIPAAKDFIGRLNGLISRKIEQNPIDATSPMARTQERMRAAAKAGHAWIALDGQALRITLPVEPDEWSRAKAAFLKDAAENVAKVLGGNTHDENYRIAVTAIRCLAAGPVSYLDEGSRVQFLIGRRDVPTTLRVDIRDKYEPSLEKVVAAAIPTDFDKAAALSLLGRETAPPTVATALKAGVPEASVGALLHWAKAGDDAEKDAVIQYLHSWAERWNRDHRLPKAPVPTRSSKEYLAAWELWYTEMKQFPLVAPGEDKSH